MITKPSEISSVSSDNLSGARIEITEPSIAKTKATITKTLYLSSSFTNLLIAPLKSFARSGAFIFAPGPCLGVLFALLFTFQFLL